MNHYHILLTCLKKTICGSFKLPVLQGFQSKTSMKSHNSCSFPHHLLLLLLLSFSCFCSTFCFGLRDTITSTNSIRDPATIISNASSFELGFFTPPNSTNRYVGIWFNQISPQTIVWVANRDTPLKDTSGIFTISQDGNLVVLDRNDTVLWSSKVSTSSATNTTAQILDSGNLVLEETASGKIIWESFKHPSDKFLPSMKLATNTRTKEKLEIASWNSPSNPSTGNFSLTLHIYNIPEAVIWNEELNIHWRSGPWNGQTFIGIPNMNSVYLFGFNLVIEDQTYTLSVAYNSDAPLFAYMVLTSRGNVERKQWSFEELQWEHMWSALQTQCDYYGACGAFGICDAKSSPICSCSKGFKPRREDEWNRGHWSDGCVRNTPFKCEDLKNTSTEEDGFLKMGMVKVPFLAEWSNSSVSVDDCRRECLANCSCNAYAFQNSIGCMLWGSNLTDIQKFESGGADLYLRMANADLATNDLKNHKGIIIAIVLPMLIVFIILIYFLWWRWKTHKAKEKKIMVSNSKKEKVLKLRKNNIIDDEIKLEELPLYDFEQLEIATNSFDLCHKLGQGGFGPVYKGKLSSGEEIAIKRLSKASNQGYEEFINEVKVISKLQHRNLVRLLGCCIEGEEKILIYEYMPNLSLDAFIFDSIKQKLLDWRKRFNIIDGIARGLLYLHRDSRLRIIHRDLKASNILLDPDLNPKISDFGMARIFGGNEVQANTLRVVGTYGYMSPEYAMQGQFSEKSDVFSFGVLLLEIISGRRNTGFYCHEQSLSLLEFAWKLWMENNLVPLIDPTIYEFCYLSEILRCIQVGLLCVEEFVNDRPNVSTIISMLNSEIIDLPIPKQPSFIGRQLQTNTKTSNQCSDKDSVNSVTITTVIGR